MYNRINLMLPTYKRVANGKLPKFISSACEMCDDPRQIVFTFLVNEDDNETLDYLKSLITPCSFQFLITPIIDKPHLGRYFNQIYNETRFNDEWTLASMVGDDMVFLTRGYDTQILSAANRTNGVGIIYCDDDHAQHEKLCVNMFVSRKYVSGTGLPFMPDFRGDCLDNYWMEIGRAYGGCHYFNNVKIKHEHGYIEGKSDDCFVRARANNDLSVLNQLPELVRYAEQNLKAKGVR